MKKFLLLIAVVFVIFLVGCESVKEEEKVTVEKNQEIEQNPDQEIENMAYDDDTLIEMLKKYLLAKGEHVPAKIDATKIDDYTVRLRLYDDTTGNLSITDWYDVNRYSAIGKNILNETVDFNLIDYLWFSTDSYHAQQPAGAAMQDVYYFAGDHTYFWLASGTSLNERVISKSGTWNIYDNKLYLHEQEETYLDGGKTIDIKDDPMLGDATILVGYTVTKRPVNEETEIELEYVGVSEYSPEDRQPGDEVNEYKADGEIWYTNINPATSNVDEWLELSNHYNESYNK